MPATLEDILTVQDLEDLKFGREMRKHLENNFAGQAHHSCLALIRQAVQLEAEVSEYTKTNVKIAGQPVGDWKVVVVKIEAGQNEP